MIMMSGVLEECDWGGRYKRGIHKKEKGWKKVDFAWRKVTRTICR